MSHANVQAPRQPQRDVGQRWGVAVVAALPALLVALAMPLVIEGSLSGFVYAPLVIVVTVVTAGLGMWAGLVAVVLVTLVGAIVGPGGHANSTFWLAGALAGTLLIGTWLGQVLARGRWAVAAAIPGIALIVGVLATGVTGTPESGVLAAFTTLSIVLLLYLLGPWSDETVRPARWAQVLAIATMLVVTLVTYAVSVNSAPLVGTADRIQLFGSSDPGPKAEGGVPDPFLIAARWQLDPTEAGKVLFDVDLSKAAPLNRPVWASFSSYNGISWTEPATYGVSGDDIPVDKDSAAAKTYRAPTRIHINAALPGQWVPVPQRVAQVLSSVATRVDPITGVTATVSSPIDQGFDIQYLVPIADDVTLHDATAAHRSGLDPAVALPGPLTGPMGDLADQIAQQAGDSMWDRLTLLSQKLRADSFRPALPQALAAGPPDRSYAGLNRVLAEGVGFQEQYAAIWALIARSWGVPTRLSIGFPTEPGTGMHPVLAPTVSIWPEARLSSLGWIAFQPSPQDRAAGRSAAVRPLTPAEVPARPAPAPSSSASASAGGSDAQSQDKVGPITAVSRAVPWPIVIPIVLLLGVIGWLVYVASRRRRVRAALRQGSPRESAAGAWTWMRLMVAEGWIPLPLSYAPAEDADRPLDMPDEVADAVWHMARVSGPARYSGQEATGADALGAWDQADEVARAVARTTGWRTTVRRWVIPLEPGNLAAAVVSEGSAP